MEVPWLLSLWPLRLLRLLWLLWLLCLRFALLSLMRFILDTRLHLS
jgi:hypothetical protein